LDLGKCVNVSRFGQATLIDCTPLHAAAYIGDLAITELLWQHGAEQKTNFVGMYLGFVVLVHRNRQEVDIELEI